MVGWALAASLRNVASRATLLDEYGSHARTARCQCDTRPAECVD